jgi:hypothetical protein
MRSVVGRSRPGRCIRVLTFEQVVGRMPLRISRPEGASCRPTAWYSSNMECKEFAGSARQCGARPAREGAPFDKWHERSRVTVRGRRTINSSSMFIAAYVAGLAVQAGFREASSHSTEFTEGWGQLFDLFIFFLFGLIVTLAFGQLPLSMFCMPSSA